MIAAICCMPFGTTQALILPEEEPVIVYCMPQTQLLLTAEYDEIVTEVGQFYQYSERYLGTKDVITKAERQFVLTGMKLKPTAVADTTRTYVLRDKNVKLQWVSLSPFGTLTGYNLPSEPKTNKHAPNGRQAGNSKTETFIGTEHTHPMPLLEEQLMASSTAKMAEGAAKQIYRIREMRLNMLAGEVEKAPADGEAMKLILKEMDKREQELTALFVGRRIVTHHKQCFTYTPANTDKTPAEQVLFRFSKHFGIVAADDLSGEPVTVHLSKNAHQLVTPEKPAKKTEGSLYYNLPGSGELVVTYDEQEMINHPVTVAQWGVSVPVNNALLGGTTRIIFDPLTGALVSIEK